MIVFFLAFVYLVEFKDTLYFMENKTTDTWYAKALNIDALYRFQAADK